jgi:hypothetical protein
MAARLLHSLSSNLHHGLLGVRRFKNIEYARITMLAFGVFTRPTTGAHVAIVPHRL